MNAPSDKQARVLWMSMTALAVGVLLALIGLLLWGFGWVLNRLSSVILPLAIGAILACLLDPLVDFFEKRKIPRMRAIILVFFLLVMGFLVLLATVVPQLIVETNELINGLPGYARELQTHLGESLARTAWGARAKAVWDSQYGATAQEWLTRAFPVVTTWVWDQVSRVVSLAGFIFGLALVPVYTFYLLLEKRGIQKYWTNYLPLRESKWKEEAVFIIGAINESLIVFFRGQVLVALCDGLLLTIGFLCIGLKYAFLLGFVAGLLSIVPYLGVMISLVPAVGLAVAQHGDWYHPVMVLLIFAIVQALEGLVISPRIIGDRVGMHPLTIIIAVMVGTTLMGGLLGGLLAIPLTAALRALMFRYVWVNRR